MGSNFSYYPKLWQKSFLIEIVRKDNGMLHRSFAFSLPPESVKIQVPQRVNVRKTFGGVFVDDYGIDSAPISIKGTTGNSSMKEVYVDPGLGGGIRFMDGKNEAQFIMREILNYKHKRDDYDKYEMRLFDLSTLGDLLTGTMLSKLETLDVSGWRVVLRDGSIERSKEKPFFFDYSLDFLAVEPIGIKKYSFMYQPAVITKIFSAIEQVRVATNAVRKALASYKKVTDTLRLVAELTDQLEQEARTFYRAMQGFIDTTVDGINSVFDIIAFPFDLAEDLIKAVRDVRSGVEDVYQSFTGGIQNLEDRATIIADLSRDVFSLESWAAAIGMDAKSAGALPQVHIVPLDSPAAQVAVNSSDPTQELSVGYMLTFGYSTRVATSETRLDALSNQIYGSPDYADIIAQFNEITGDSDIVPGLQIKLPFLTYVPSLQASEVYATGTEMYGTDIALASDGDLVLAEYNDYGYISGLSNIEQALVLRLSEDSGARVRLVAYGIKQSGGNFDPFSLAVLISSIRDTLVQDSRIQDAYGFSLRQDGDMMYLSFDVELESGATTTYSLSI